MRAGLTFTSTVGVNQYAPSFDNVLGEKLKCARPRFANGRLASYLQREHGMQDYTGVYMSRLLPVTGEESPFFLHLMGTPSILCGPRFSAHRLTITWSFSKLHFTVTMRFSV